MIKKAIALLLGIGTILVGWGAFWHVASAPSPALVIAAKPVSIVFMGDIMLDRGVAAVGAHHGTEALFASSSELFMQTDLRVANLEGPITDNPSIAAVNHDILHFTFDPAFAESVLVPLNLSAVSLANNHTYDFGKAGYLQTRDYLSQWGINAFGNPYNEPGYLSTRIEARNKMICLVGYMQLFSPATSSVVAEIQTLRPTCDKIVVFAHWGVEYSHDATPAQVAAAHAFIDAGADMVIGAHPHVVEPVETYKGKAIVYSLGNAMFDQDFSWDTEHGLAVRVDFFDDKTRLVFIPLTIEGERSYIAEGLDREQVLAQAGVGSVATIILP